MQPNEQSMIGVREQDRQYRRGMVLGLTMAEIMLLLIFLLLLLLAAKLLADREAVKQALADRDRAVAAQVETAKQLADLQSTLDDFKRKNPEDYDILKEYQKAKTKLAETEKKLEKAESAMEILEPVQKQAIEMSPGADPKEAIENLQAAAMVGHQALASGKSPDELIAGATCQKDLDQCKEGNVDMSKRLALKGGTLPSCWIDAMTGRPQYIFTATLRDDGIYLHDNKLTGREADQAKLPIAPLAFEHSYQSAEFVAAGQKLFQWSDAQDPACRFYVRLIDETANDKFLYKSLKEKGVEHIFFTLPTN
jgi:hypothetical protein